MRRSTMARMTTLSERVAALEAANERWRKINILLYGRFMYEHQARDAGGHAYELLRRELGDETVMQVELLATMDRMNAELREALKSR
jgi:hypothetical protein